MKISKFAALVAVLATLTIVNTACEDLSSTGAKEHPFSAHGNGKQATKDAPKAKAVKKQGVSMTTSQEQAVGSAQEYLAFDAFSRSGLIDQLHSKAGEGFSLADATFAVDHIKVDWNAEAVKSAKSYLKFTHFSRAGLIDQLSSKAGEGFTKAQAEYAATQVGL